MKKVSYFCIKIFITLSHARKVTSFYLYIFCSPVPLLFLFQFRGQRCLILLNGVLFIWDILNKIILLCMDYVVALRLEKNESWKKWFHCKRSRFSFFEYKYLNKLRKNYPKFVWLTKSCTFCILPAQSQHSNIKTTLYKSLF